MWGRTTLSYRRIITNKCTRSGIENHHQNIRLIIASGKIHQLMLKLEAKFLKGTGHLCNFKVFSPKYLLREKQ